MAAGFGDDRQIWWHCAAIRRHSSLVIRVRRTERIGRDRRTINRVAILIRIWIENFNFCRNRFHERVVIRVRILVAIERSAFFTEIPVRQKLHAVTGRADFFVDLETALNAFLIKLTSWHFCKWPTIVWGMCVLRTAGCMSGQAKSHRAKTYEERTEEFHIRKSLFGWRRRGRVMSKNGLVDGVRLAFWTFSQTQDWEDQEEVGEIVSRHDLRQVQEAERRRDLNGD
mmetsp:Transcript_22315/g.28643  ORF Transcript_22315/g.28643 Transcript_22315/m.28643 type:complete len:227 (-) Transcript_22315:1954-2634(-)